MNPYARLASGMEGDEAVALCARLTAWHDAMVAHERKLRMGRADTCDEECPHAEARRLWAESLAIFGPRASDLTFLRTRAASTSRALTPNGRDGTPGEVRV